MNSIAIELALVIASLLALISTLAPAYAAEVAADITFGSSSKTTEAFAPNPLNINAGDTVAWTNKDLQPHTVTSGSDAQPDGKFDSSPGLNPLILSQATFNHTFEREGEFPYYCALHPHMIGTVIVGTGNANGDAGNYQPEPTLLLVGSAIFATTLVVAYIGYTKFARNRHRSVGGPKQLLHYNWQNPIIWHALSSSRLHNTILAFVLISSLLPFVPVAAQEEIVLEAASNHNTFTVEITWTTSDIGSANAFELRFIEPETGVEIEDVIYDFSIYGDGDREVLRRDQMATQQEFTFDEQGPYEIRIDNIEGLGEGVSVPIEVTPEFPPGVLVVVAGTLGAALFFASRNINSLFRL